MDAQLSLRELLQGAVLRAMHAACERPMQWGADDCALWCANMLQDALGYDAAADFRGRYRTQRGAKRVLGKTGLVGALKRAARRHRWVRIPAMYAETGDIGIMIGPGGPSTVMCRAPGWFIGRNEQCGFTAFSASKVAMAWSVDGSLRDGDGLKVCFPKIPLKPERSRGSTRCHEPVSAAIGLTALLEGTGAFAAGSVLGGIGLTAASVGGAIVTGAVLVGLSIAQSYLTPRPSGAGPLDNTGFGGNNNSADLRYTERQPTPSQRVILGRAYVGGALFFEQVKPPYLYAGLLLNRGQIDGIEAAWIGTNQLSFANITFNAALTPLAVSGQPNYPSRLQCSFRSGTTTQTIDPIIAAAFTNLDSEFRQRGIATAVFRYHYGADATEHTALWGQVFRPNAYLLVRGVQCYDPRDPTQDLNDESTWKWNNNASLVQAYYLTRDWGGRIAKSRMLWDKVAAAADFDDEPVWCQAASQYIKRYTIDGVVTLNQKPFDVMQGLLTANRGRVLESGGRVWVSSSKPRTPIAAIYDKILAGGLEYRAAKPKKDLVNKLQTRFVSLEQDYQTTDGPVLNRTDLQAADGEVLPATLELPFTLRHERVQRLAKAFLETSRLGRGITCSVDVSVLTNCDDELVGSAVTFASDLFAQANGTYIVDSVAFADNFSTLQLSLSEYDATIETDWNPAVDEQPFQLANLNLS